MSLIIKKLRYKNFLSTGNEFVEFNFTEHRSTLVVGNNGSGKSSFIDALVFGLYGKPHRKINKPQLLNSINNKDLVVEIELENNNHSYLIRRGIKPNIFEIYQNDELINQDSKSKDYQSYLEENILKIGYKAFNQIVVLGSAQHVAFMQLSPQARREIIEDLLDLQIFSIMNNLLKERVNLFKADYTQNEIEVKLIDQKIELARNYINEIQKNMKTRHENINAKKKEYTKEIVGYDKKLASLEKIEIKLLEKIEEFQKMGLDEKSKLIDNSMLKIKHQQKDIDSKISFYKKNDSCPTCKQELDGEFISNEIQILEKESKTVTSKLSELVRRNSQLESLLQKRLDVLSKYSTLTKEKSGLLNQKSFAVRRISDLDDELIRLESEKPQITNLDQLENEKLDLINIRKELIEQKDVINSAAFLLKDGGIKARIIKQYIPIMNKLISKYLAEMDFFIQFELDEDFNETILSRYRDNFSYESFSEGEKFRIDLSLLFTWRAISKLRNSTTCNLLILDEIFDSSLDSAGTDDFLKIMYSLTSGTNVFIISHRLDTMADKFDNVTRFVKENNFSKMSKEI